jgi:hypothetical protein
MIKEFIQKAIKVYPHTYTGDSLEKLNTLLSEGWKVKHITLSFEGKDGAKIYDYILEKQLQTQNNG